MVRGYGVYVEAVEVNHRAVPDSSMDIGARLGVTLGVRRKRKKRSKQLYRIEATKQLPEQSQLAQVGFKSLLHQLEGVQNIGRKSRQHFLVLEEFLIFHQQPSPFCNNN